MSILCTFQRAELRMRRLLVQTLCIAALSQLVLCATDPSPLSEDTLRSEAFITALTLTIICMKCHRN